jgi:class 3 adenylate cyclase
LERERRRLAAILAADVASYSRLMSRDESRTLARLKEHRHERPEPVLACNRGRLVKLMGDGALVEFRSAFDTLRAAIEFQQAASSASARQTGIECIVFRRPEDRIRLAEGLHLAEYPNERAALGLPRLEATGVGSTISNRMWS